jgi:hypothetical protein
MAAGPLWQEVAPLVRAVTDPGVITTRQAITPAGVRAQGLFAPYPTDVDDHEREDAKKERGER